MHFLRTSKAKEGHLAFKVDLAKAYDKVDLRYLKFIWSKFGFPKHIISLIMFYVTFSLSFGMGCGFRLFFL